MFHRFQPTRSRFRVQLMPGADWLLITAQCRFISYFDLRLTAPSKASA